MIAKTVADAMTDAVETVPPDVTAAVAASRLRRREVGSLVVAEDGEVIGIVAESDFVALVSERADPTVPVSAFMSAPVVTTTSETELSAAARTMRGEGVKKLPVVDDGELVGIVTTTDLAHFLPRYRTEVEWTGKPLVERRKSFPPGR
jgi:CBS domain-containing protein